MFCFVFLGCLFCFILFCFMFVCLFLFLLIYDFVSCIQIRCKFRTDIPTGNYWVQVNFPCAQTGAKSSLCNKVLVSFFTMKLRSWFFTSLLHLIELARKWRDRFELFWRQRSVCLRVRKMRITKNASALTTLRHLKAISVILISKVCFAFSEKTSLKAADWVFYICRICHVWRNF